MKYKSALPAGSVIATSPRAGNKCSYGFDTHIFLTVRLKPGQTLPANINLNPPKESDTVRVPALQKTLADTIKIIKAKGLVPQVNYEVTKFAHFKNKIKPGSVPAWNTIVKKGSKVSFTVYTLKAVVPPVTVFDEKTAISLIEKNNLKASVSYSPTDMKSQDGRVRGQTPAKGTLVEPGSTVKLLVYRFSGMTTMPNILFRRYGQSVTDLLTNYFNLKHKIVQIPTEFEDDDGKIIKTIPGSGAKVKEGTIVELHVYRLSDKAKRLVPNVKFLLLKEAEQLLGKKGFKIRVKEVLNDSASLAGRVSSQNPAAGMRLNPGTTIALSVIKYSGSMSPPVAPVPSLSKRLQVSQPSASAVSQIKDFYNQFKDAYESKDEYRVISLISSGWGSNDGNTISDLEDNLHNIFTVFDEIQYRISNLSVQPDKPHMYQVSYNVAIKGTIFESNITHNEKSSVRELVKLKDGKVQIIKTLTGKFWSVD